MPLIHRDWRAEDLQGSYLHVVNQDRQQLVDALNRQELLITQLQNQLASLPKGGGSAPATPSAPVPASAPGNTSTPNLSLYVPGTRQVATTAPLTGGGDLTADRTLAIDDFTGDTGTGGAKGAVPAPAAGDAAAHKYLKASGGFEAIAEADVTNLVADLASKLDKNVAIAAATKTKVTYDANGLITGGADATTADIADSVNKRYVTDAELALIPVSGAATTRNAVRTAYSGAAIGTLYLSTAGKAYLKVANAGADADWERITTAASD